MLNKSMFNIIKIFSIMIIVVFLSACGRSGDLESVKLSQTHKIVLK